MGRAGLVELAERCEQASGPDRELDAVIAVAIRWHPYGTTHWLARYDREFFAFDDGFIKKINSTDYRNEPLPGGGWDVPEFTASLDAAMTLASHPEIKQFGGPAGIIREAMDRLYASGGALAERYSEALARFVTAASLRARAQAPDREEGCDDNPQ